MAWRDKPLSEPMVGSLLTHVCVTRPQWVKKTLYLGTLEFNPETVTEIVSLVIRQCISKMFIKICKLSWRPFTNSKQFQWEPTVNCVIVICRGTLLVADHTIIRMPGIQRNPKTDALLFVRGYWGLQDDVGILIFETSDLIHFMFNPSSAGPTHIHETNISQLLVHLPRIFPGAPLKINGSPGNIQGNLTGMWSSQ